MQNIIDMKYSHETDEWSYEDHDFDSSETFVQTMLEQLNQEYLDNEIWLVNKYS